MLDDEHDVVALGKLAQHGAERRHVARVEAHRRLVEHEQRALERRAECRRQRHALGLTAREGARLAIERQVAEPDSLEVRQAPFELPPRKLALTGVRREDGNLPARNADLEAVPGGEIASPHAERECRVVQSPPAAGPAHVVPAIAREQHAYVKLVRLGLEPAEPAKHTREFPLVPAAVAFEHHEALGGGERGPRLVERHAAALAELCELAALPARGGTAKGPHRTFRDRARRVRHHLLNVDAERATETATGAARADRRVVRKEPAAWCLERTPAARTTVPTLYGKRAAAGMRPNAPLGTRPADLDRLRETRGVTRGNEPVEHDGKLGAVGERAGRGETVEIDGFVAAQHAAITIADQRLAHLEVAFRVCDGKRVGEHGALRAEGLRYAFRSGLGVEPNGVDMVLGTHGPRLAQEQRTKVRIDVRHRREGRA